MHFLTVAHTSLAMMALMMCRESKSPRCLCLRVFQSTCEVNASMKPNDFVHQQAALYKTSIFWHFQVSKLSLQQTHTYTLMRGLTDLYSMPVFCATVSSLPRPNIFRYQLVSISLITAALFRNCAICFPEEELRLESWELLRWALSPLREATECFRCMWGG